MCVSYDRDKALPLTTLRDRIDGDPPNADISNLLMILCDRITSLDGQIDTIRTFLLAHKTPDESWEREAKQECVGLEVEA